MKCCLATVAVRGGNEVSAVGRNAEKIKLEGNISELFELMSEEEEKFKSLSSVQVKNTCSHL